MAFANDTKKYVYEVNLVTFLQTNVTTGSVRRIRRVAVTDGGEPGADVSAEAVYAARERQR